MKKISFNYLSILKNLFPILWFGILAFAMVMMIVTKAYQKAPAAIVVPCLMAIFAYFMMKKLVWDLVDEVYDCGDFLLVRNRGEEEKVSLSDIINVSATLLVNPPRVTLRLARPGRFGEEISFSPVSPFTLNPFARNQVTDDLITRVDRARSTRLE
ncbi:MAG: hypothetical protein WBQ69_04445 [Gallionella sp.]